MIISWDRCMWMSRIRVALLLINPVLFGDFDHPAIFDHSAISIPFVI
jgi:hypothetical protein